MASLEGAVATRGRTRGFLGDVMLKAIDVVTGKVVDQAADFTASAIVKKVDAQVKEGVYRLSPDALTPLKDSAALAQVPSRPKGPILVLVHGTFSRPAARSASCGRSIRSASRAVQALRSASTRSTTRRSARARSPTR